jgi:hypothetical protein
MDQGMEMGFQALNALLATLRAEDTGKKGN